MLDTDIASYTIKRHSPAVAARLAELPPSSVCISAVTRAELQYGLRRIPPGHRLHLVVQRFLRIVRTLAWNGDAADHYADIRHQLLRSGQPIGELDMMIAAHAIAAQAILVTNNMRHFGRISTPLAMENWMDGPM
ncbi:MAG TPA: PIN domain-containing protein [Acetobacteraceae bacterium]|jgi:tRNA(fMet)-specific endonuclease VapC